MVSVLHAKSETEAVEHTSATEDLVTLLLAAWLVGGLFVDGYAHAYIIDTDTEDFFTPWHGIFYAGFAALVAWVGLVGYRRRRPAPLLEWFPPSYRPALVGLVIFAVGGVGDGFWHTAFGLEVGIDALLSPTHLVLFSGGLLAIWTPVRSSLARGDRSPLLAIGTVTLVTALLVFFVQYLWLLTSPFYARQSFDAVTRAGTTNVQIFFGGAVASTMMLLGPLLLIARRWVLPVGTATVVWTTAAALESLAFSQEFWPVVLVGIGGVAFDIVHGVIGPSPWRLRAAAFAGPAVLFTGYLVWASIGDDIGWPPEIWGGLVCLVGFVGLGLVLLQESYRAEP